MTAANIKPKEVLLVEDDAFLASLLQNRLKKEGLEVDLAIDSETALKILKTRKPNLILMDIILPGKSGFEAMESILSNPEYGRIPVIIISNLGQEADIAKGKELGAVDYFVKAQTPIDELVKKIKNFLNK